jgi:hypothetical protein
VLASQAQAVAAAQALTAIQAKVEDFFARCQLAAFDARALAPLSPSVEGYALLGRSSCRWRPRPLPICRWHPSAPTVCCRWQRV